MSLLYPFVYPICGRSLLYPFVYPICGWSLLYPFVYPICGWSLLYPFVYPCLRAYWQGSLPKELKEYPNLYVNDPKRAVEAFKNKLDNYLNTIPDEPNLSAEYGKRIQGLNIKGDKTNSIVRIHK